MDQDEINTFRNERTNSEIGKIISGESEMHNSNFNVGDTVYFLHSVWIEWYQGKITRSEKEFEGCFKYIIHHRENEYYYRYSYDENVVKELPEGTYFNQMTFAPDTI